MNGIDCSHFQVKINWPIVTTNDPKIDFVFLKATQGTAYIDPSLTYNANEAHSAAIKLSYYHFATLNSHDEIIDARSEARFFLSVINKLPKNDFPLALDIEENKTQLDKMEVLNWINAFFDEMKRGGHENLFLYSYSPFLMSNLPINHNIKNNLWLAGYVKESKLRIPAGWLNYEIWQYTAMGKVKGITGNVDMNITNQPIY